MGGQVAEKYSYRDYTADGTYWTVRKRGKTFWVLRLKSGSQEQCDVWGGYTSPGAAASAAAQLAYGQAVDEVRDRLRVTLHGALEEIGLGAEPQQPPVAASSAPANLGAGPDD
ncbi:hypothetical protein EV137_4327 [Kribbella pratensis]|uniref:WGR domain-containing protein n=1 Tax=Kribbella pratensis TaxID=2512112 RepID=A0ABY2FGK4_9ACTN|nr:hypothetical protein EV137_4327 [Kribbella pratensis]